MASGVSTLVALWCLVAASELPPVDMTRVRGVAPLERGLLETGICRSRTFAALVDAIQQTDIIVFVSVKKQLSAGLDGRLAFMGARGGVRYLRIDVLEGTSPERTIAAIGHELQHALEIGTHPQVRSSWEVAALYERIGDRVAGPNRYDTVAARRAGEQVRQELAVW